MYKLLIVDDEQIVLESITYIVSKFISQEIHIETAHSGREAIEKAETYRPDIVIMDINMPGISGLDAIADIKKFHSALFIIITAYEKFDFAKEALNLGAIEYITKPLSRQKIISAIESAIHIKEEERLKRETELQLKEKMALIVPALENGFIYSLVFSGDYLAEAELFKKILEIPFNGGYVMTIEFGEAKGKEGISNKIGSSIKSQLFYPHLRDALKESCTCIVGPVMLNRVIAYIPTASEVDEYTQRINALNVASEVYKKLQTISNVDFFIGIGKNYGEIKNAYKSYEESVKAIGYAPESGILHINDIPLEQHFKKEYPEDEERLLMKKLVSGEPEACFMAFNRICDWLSEQYGDNVEEYKSNLTELLVVLGRTSKEYGTADKSVKSGEYIREFLSLPDAVTLRTWFFGKIRGLSEKIAKARENNLSSVIVTAREFIDKNYSRDITLEEVSREVNVSPNYFSKLFKDETGNNFIDYLTTLRIEKAKQLLKDSNFVNKEISDQIGYADPNYFSRIFKKVVGITPTEYRSTHLQS